MMTIGNLTAGYGAAPVLTGISLNVKPGQVIAVLGANGAGKTTLLRTISGLIRASNGSVFLNGHELTRETPAQILMHGVSHVPEGRRIFPGLTVSENLVMGAYALKDRSQVKANFERVLALFPKLGERNRQIATSLSGGEQQMLAIGRALMSSPNYLLLDEPSMGLAPRIVERLFESLHTLRQNGLGIILVEQNAHIGADVADQILVLSRGQIVHQGEPKRWLSIQELMSAYLRQ